MLWSVDSFKQLVDASATTFLGVKTRKIETSYLFKIKQDEEEPLREYLDTFYEAILQVKIYSDDTLIQAFWEGTKDKMLVSTTTYEIPPNFAHLRGITRKHAEADEYMRGRGLIPGEES